MTNPLLSTAPLPDFAAVRAEHVGPALDVLLAEADAALAQATSESMPADYRRLEQVLAVPVERLSSAWGTVTHLQAVADTPALREAQSQNLPRVTDFFTRVSADARLYAKYKAVAASPAAALSPAQAKALANTLRDFVLGGAELQGEAREQFMRNEARAAELSLRFGENTLDATDRFALYMPLERLSGVPQDVIDAARAAAAAEGRSDFKLTLHQPCYRPVLEHADDRALREQMYAAYAQRASEFGPAELDNGPVMQQLMSLRQQQASLLGHGTYAELSLVAKMARSPDEVLAFIRDLARRARPQAERDLEDLRSYARSELGIAELQSWDVSYASEKMRQRRYAFSSTELKQYFTADKVLAGLFALVQRLFDVEIRPAEASVWHPSVSFHTVHRGSTQIGAFYLDPYARTGKQPGAWMDAVRQRWRRPDSGELQLPVAHLVCNFAPPGAGAPSLLSHDDVITVFHEFGHGLHHLLTQVDDAGVAGIAGVEWDAAELPSQFMENFCWEWSVLQSLSGHVATGEPLPRALFDRMLAARNFHNALHMLRHCEYGLFDMRLHVEPGAAARIQALVEEVRHEVAVMTPPEYLRYPHTFGHLFDGGYAAGYYGYQWAEVLAADAFSAFEESGLYDATTSRRWREEVLERGGSRTAMENFIAFRGRAPTIDALLRHQGLA